MNKNIFNTNTRDPSVRNKAGGIAYDKGDREALAQMALTGTFNGTFYASGGDQLDIVKGLCDRLPVEYVLKCAIMARTSGYMKDMPAYMLAHTCRRDQLKSGWVFSRIINNTKMMRNFMTVIRSGAVGSKNFPNQIRYAMKKWFANAHDRSLFNWTGTDISVADAIKMIHPKPATKERSALYAYLLGRGIKSGLPQFVIDFENFKKTKVGAVPRVNFLKLTSLGLETREWTAIAKTAPWHMTRMNLNTFQRHGVFDQPGMVKMISDRLSDPVLIKESDVFPYQLYMAYKMADNVPVEIREALQDAMDIATQNVPSFDGAVAIGVDVSGSMRTPITGNGNKPSSVMCGDVAGLMTSTIIRQNKDTIVIPFDTRAYRIDLNPRDSIMTNTKKLGFSGGGTNIGIPLAVLNGNMKQKKIDVVIIISDNESWADHGTRSGWGNCSVSQWTNTMKQWRIYKGRNPKAKLVLIDLSASSDSQVRNEKDILCIGGFSSFVWNIIDEFIDRGEGDLGSLIDKVKL